MKHITTYIRFACLYACAALFFACQQPGAGVEQTGSEYMPDMGHSVAYEANYYNYYYLNTWGTEDEYYDFAKPRLPVPGTVARGFAGTQDDSKLAKEALHFTPNGAVPYYYGDNDDERNRATAEIIDNPYPITDAGLARGKELYDIFCGICHGQAGDGAGYLVREDGGKYPVQPANLLLPEFVEASNGRYYHALYYGKNKMGAYKDKISYEERWQVIHYVRALQAKELKLEYNQIINTLNDIDRPAGEDYNIAMADHAGEHMTDADHGDHDGEAHHENDHDDNHSH